MELIDAVEIPADLAKAYRLAMDEIKRFERAAATVEELIKRELGEHEYATVDGEPVVRWAHVKSRRLDMDALRESVDPAILASCYVQKEGRRFIVLAKKDAA